MRHQLEKASSEKKNDMGDTFDDTEKKYPVLQITPDIEEEIAEVERGETVSMSEFKSMFSRWLDRQ